MAFLLYYLDIYVHQLIRDGRDGGSSGLLVLSPSSDRLQNLQKGRKNMLFLQLHALLCVEMQMYRSGRLLCGKGTKELVKRSFQNLAPFPALPTSLLSDWGAQQRLSQADEQRQRAGDAF